MRSSSFSRNHPYAKTRGWVSPKRAASSLPTITDGVNEVDDASEIWVQGGTVDEPEEGVARISFGGQAIGSNSAGGTGGSANPAALPVRMFNSSGISLIPGDVVVTDPTVDSGVTTTATASNTRIAGIVQAPIDVAQWGPVLFNGFAPIVNTTGTISRGNYALTSATAALAGATAARVAGSFGVYLTGTDFPDFVVSSATTEQDVVTTELEITMPINIPAARVLFLALWLESGASAVDVDGWTLIGSESGFYYFYKISEGDDTATATWTTASLAVAVVLLLHPNVSLSNPIAAHDYDTSTSAAAVSGMSNALRYAIAGVQATATPGSGYSRLGGGSAGFVSAGTPSLVQSKQGHHSSGGGDLTFDSTLTAASMMVSVTLGEGPDTWSTDSRAGGCVIDANMTSVGFTDTNFLGSGGINSARIQAKNVSAADLYSGPFGTKFGCTSGGAWLLLMEWEGVTLGDYETSSVEGVNTGTVDCGTFTGVGADDLLIMAVVSKEDGYGGGERTITPNGFTEITDGNAIVNGWTWVGYKVGDGDASVGAQGIAGGWGGVAVLFRQGSSSVAGTLAGKYIGSDAAATSPFTGGGAQNDAIITLNLTSAAKASALLYGPDLGGSGGSEPSADAHIADTSDAHDASAVSFTPAGTIAATDVQAAIEEVAAEATSGSLPWFNVMDYGAVGDGTTDDTADINSAIAALIAAGKGVLYFPSGDYLTTGGLTSITVPCWILGDGMTGNDIPGTGASKIRCNSTSARLFDINSLGVKMEGLSLVQTGGTPTSGSEAIRAGNATPADFFQLIGCSTTGFYHAVNIENGTGWTMDRCLVHGFAHHGLDALYNSVPDGLDAQISNNHFDGATYSAAVGVYLKSGGGAKLIGNKVNSNSGLVYGLFLDIPASNDSSLLIIDGNSFEGWDDTGIKVTSTGGGTSIVRGIIIVGNELAMTTGASNKKCIDVVGAETNDLYEVIVVGNKLGAGPGSSGPAVGMTNVNWPLVGNNTWSGYANEATFTTCANVRDATGMVGAGVVISGTPSSGQVPVASSGIAAAWGTPSAAPSGAAGGDLSGTYPNPSVVDDSHSHTSSTAPGGFLVISDTPSTPLVFADILQNEAEDDFIYSD